MTDKEILTKEINRALVYLEDLDALCIYRLKDATDFIVESLVELVERKKEIEELRRNEMRHICFTELQRKIVDWAEERNLLSLKNRDKQFMKLMEEVFEFKTEMDDFFKLDGQYKSGKNMRLEFGDILVTLLILAEQLKLDSMSCLEDAYHKIEHREGETIGGQFIKKEDL